MLTDPCGRSSVAAEAPGRTFRPACGQRRPLLRMRSRCGGVVRCVREAARVSVCAQAFEEECLLGGTRAPTESVIAA
eukprot:5093986-Pleurochrysis_carterae.AAC.1